MLKPKSDFAFRFASVFSAPARSNSTALQPNSGSLGARCSPLGEFGPDFGLRMLGIPPARETADAHQVVGCEAKQRLAGEFLATDQLGLAQTTDGFQPAEGFLNALAHFERGLAAGMARCAGIHNAEPLRLAATCGVTPALLQSIRSAAAKPIARHLLLHASYHLKQYGPLRSVRLLGDGDVEADGLAVPCHLDRRRRTRHTPS